MKILCFLIEIFLINYVATQNSATCGSFVPSSIMNCTSLSTYTNYCCMLTSLTENTNYLCANVNRASYLFTNNRTRDNRAIDCGPEADIYNGTSCGSGITPLNKTDCNIYNTDSNTCCYVNFGGYSSCILLDSSYKGTVLKGNIILQCYSNYLSINFLIIILINYLLL